MKPDLKHLEPSCAQLLELAPALRCEKIREDVWVKYPHADNVLKELNKLLTGKQGIRTNNLLVLARADNGKTTILDRFVKQHPVFVNENHDSQMPVMSIQMPHAPTDSRIFTAILKAAAISHRESESAQRKEQQALRAMRYLNVRMLLIDNINHISLGGAKQHRSTLAMLKNFGTELKIPLVGMGTRDAATAIALDSQMTSRFKTMPLPLWELNADYQRLLASIERLTPLLNPSKLSSLELAPLIHNRSGGTIGATVRLIKAAAEIAICEGTEQITADIIHQMDWTTHNDFGKVAASI